MRLRKIPNASELVGNHPNFVSEPEKYKGKWTRYFQNTNPLHIEIGSGKGRFITTLARQNKDINYIALERQVSVLAKLTGKIPDTELKNLAVVNADAELLPQFFSPGEISRIYLNFSDPWPKKRHAKRRLTNSRFLEIYKVLLKDDGIISFKTDNRDFFEYSIEQFELSGYSLINITYDLHKSPLADGNVTTEYEERFLKQGLPIYALTARKDILPPLY
ncbi:MAG: tRNA (guanosine(46)-N7)-methyltransferase TrmB [Clostridiaceae bacterium]|nr:tRNA (guanosine(46)-N7)-methyltransferase TrmB [Clostridiaceae bacterium]